MAGQRIQEAVRRHIAGDQRRRQQGRSRREEHKEIEIVLRKELMQRPATFHLSAQEATQFICVLAHQRLVLHDAGSMDNARHCRATLPPELLEQPSQRLLVSHIYGAGIHVRTLRLHIADGSDLVRLLRPCC